MQGLALPAFSATEKQILMDGPMDKQTNKHMDERARFTKG